MKKLTITLLFLLGFTHYCQAQFFKAGIVGGINVSQIDGDLIAGYTKLGLNAGFVSEIPISDRLFVNLELLFSQKGSSTALKLSNIADDFTIVTDYASIPILIKFKDLKGGLIFGAGFSINRLVRNKFTVNGLDLTDNLMTGARKPKNWDFSGLLDLSYMFKSKKQGRAEVWGIGGRFSYSLLSFRRDNVAGVEETQFHNIMSFRTIFLFSGLLQKKKV